VPGSSVRASVIVSTHNRSFSLPRTIRSVLRCDFPADAYELVVVGNACTDDTEAVVREAAQAAMCDVRYVAEPELGLHHARHAGARAARSSLLLFTDDDVEVSRSWVGAYAHAFDAHPEMAAAGGPVWPQWEADPPEWLTEHAAGDTCPPLALMSFGSEFLLAEKLSFVGANMALRREMLAHFGGFHPELFGGTALGPGESGLLEELHRAGVPIGYVPEAGVWHEVPLRRMRPEHFERWAFEGGGGDMFKRWYRKPRARGWAARELARIVRRYWRPWLKTLVTPRRPDARAVATRSAAARGCGELRYLWWMLSRADVRQYLGAERFWP
jgi:glycosyltransferase involved in cell wall biosynthesis